MDIQSLNVFIRTAELLHFGRASRACNLSPSALTRTIQRIEEELGQPVFVRDNRSVILTEAGEKLLSYARDAVQQWHSLQDSLAAEQTLSGTLSLYASVTAVYSLLPELLEAYRRAYPEVHLELRTGAAEQAVEQVLNGEIDLAISTLPDRKHSRLEFRPLAETPLVFIAPRTPEFDKLGRNGMIHLGETPLVVPQAGTARTRLDTWLRKTGTTPNISTEVSGNEALIAMVRLGTGVGIVPKLALDRSPFRKEVRLIRNAPKLESYVVGLCAGRRSLQRPIARAMWELAARHGKD